MKNYESEGEKLEKKCMKIFRNLGWEVEAGGQDLRVDLVLKIDGIIRGYVECYLFSPQVKYAQIKRLMERKMEKTKAFLKEKTPDIMIITNGVLFDVYCYGEFMYTLSVPPRAEELDLLLNLARSREIG